MFDGRFRAPIEKAVRPVGQLLRRTGMSPDHLTILGILFAIAAAFSIAQGALRGGLILVILAALPDMLDGALAKAAGSASQRGAFFDSVVDRVTDSLLFGGVAWFLHQRRALILHFCLWQLWASLRLSRMNAQRPSRSGYTQRAVSWSAPSESSFCALGCCSIHY